MGNELPSLIQRSHHVIHQAEHRRLSLIHHRRPASLRSLCSIPAARSVFRCEIKFYRGLGGWDDNPNEMFARTLAFYPQQQFIPLRNAKRVFIESWPEAPASTTAAFKSWFIIRTSAQLRFNPFLLLRTRVRRHRTLDYVDVKALRTDLIWHQLRPFNALFTSYAIETFLCKTFLMFQTCASCQVDSFRHRRSCEQKTSYW